MSKLTLTAERVRFMFNYNPETGSLTWRNPLSNNVASGDRAGSLRSNGRRYVVIDGEQHLAHRIAWLYMHGTMPAENVSAINGDYSDLRIANLAEQSASETAAKGIRSTNTSGVKGVSWSKDKKKWQATITRNYKQVVVGRFHTKEEAAVAYEAATRQAIVAASDCIEREKRYRIAAQRAIMRRLWRSTIRASGGHVGWSDYDEFISSLGDYSVDARSHIVAVDASKQVGPCNFMVVSRDFRGKVDYKTSDGKREANRAWRKANPGAVKQSELRKSFGLTLDDYSAMMSDQAGVCAICKEHETATRGGKLLSMAVDHDHKTGAIRGLLCMNCNKAIGLLKENPTLFERARAYLEHHKERERLGFASNVIPLKKKER